MATTAREDLDLQAGDHGWRILVFTSGTGVIYTRGEDVITVRYSAAGALEYLKLNAREVATGKRTIALRFMERDTITKDEMDALAQEHGWTVTPDDNYDGGFFYRRLNSPSLRADFGDEGLLRLWVKNNQQITGLRNRSISTLTSLPGDERCDGGCGTTEQHGKHIYSAVPAPDVPATPDAFQLRMFNSQWDRRIAAVSDALRKPQEEVGYGVTMLARGDLPNTSLAGYVSRYSCELEALEALREFGKVMGIER